MRHIFSCTIIAPLLTLSLSCCASQYGSQRTIVHYYPSCYRPIYELRRSEHNVGWATAWSSLFEFLLELDRYMPDKIHKGDLYRQMRQIADVNRRMASYLKTLEGDISNLDSVSGSARASLQCYDRQFKGLLDDIKTRRVSRAQARQMYSEIRSGREEATALLGHTEHLGSEMDRQYQQALDKEGRQPLNKQARRTLVKAKKQQAVLNKKVGKIAKDRVAAQRRNQAEARELERMLADIDA